MREHTRSLVPLKRNDSLSLDEWRPPTAQASPYLIDWFHVLYRRRYVAAAAFLLVFGAVAAHAFLSTRFYEARALMIIESSRPNVVAFDEVMAEERTRTDYYMTQTQVLRSRALARRALESLKAWDNPEFVSKESSQSWLAPLLASLARVAPGLASALPISRTRTPAPTVPHVEDTPEHDRVTRQFLERLSVSYSPDARAVSVSFLASDPVLAAAAVNALAQAYIDFDRSFRLGAAKEAAQWFVGQLAAQQKQVQTDELALQQYREQNRLLTTEGSQNIVTQQLVDLNSALTRARMLRIEKAALYDQIRSTQGTDSGGDASPQVLANPFIQSLKSELARLQTERARMADRFGDRHPEMIKVDAAIAELEQKVRNETAKIVESMGSELQAAQTQENQLAAALDAQKHESLDQTREAIEYDRLQRVAASSRQVAEALLRRANETDISGQIESSNARIVDSADVPQFATLPNRPLNLALGLLLGTIAAIGLVFGVEGLDDRVKSPKDVQERLGLALLGMVPSVPVSLAGSRRQMFEDGVPAAFSEAFRTIRGNILLSGTSTGVRTLLVTSTGPGEGKSTVASFLACAIACTGRSVLLVDADLRLPQLATMFNLPDGPGLSEVLSGTIGAADAVKPTKTPKLWLLPAGSNREGVADLLATERFGNVIEKLHHQFDFIVIDSPPVIPVIDACLAVGDASVVFVVRAEFTRRRAAERALAQLDASRARFAGAVLNRVDLERHSYWSDYGGEYASYYAASQPIEPVGGPR